MDFLLLDQHSRTILRLWLSCRERPHQISRIRWANLKSGVTAQLFHSELSELIDLYGYKLFDLLMLPLEEKETLIQSMRVQTDEFQDWLDHEATISDARNAGCP